MIKLSEKHKMYLCRKSRLAIKRARARNTEREKQRQKLNRSKANHRGMKSLLVAPSHFMLMSKKHHQQGDQRRPPVFSSKGL